jgi:hypothetical protein
MRAMDGHSRGFLGPFVPIFASSPVVSFQAVPMDSGLFLVSSASSVAQQRGTSVG